MLRGAIELPVLSSRLLEGNVLGDPTDREVLVYLPPSYADGGRFPLLMVLPAYAAGHRSLTNFRLWEPTFFQRYEALLADGKVPEAIIVSPDCLTRWGGSQFLDSTSTGPYQRYLVEEVLPFVDERYRTVPTREARAVVGHSSGGFGALRLGLDRPEAFAAYGSQAGDGAFELSVRPLFLPTAIAIGRDGGVVPFLERVGTQGPSRGGDFEAFMTLATAACYCPAPDAPFPHVRLPFDLETCALDEGAWADWCAHDPVVRLQRTPRAFLDAALVYLDAGDRDEHGLQFAARMIHAQLSARGAKVHHEEFSGGHRGTAHRFDESLPRLLAVLETG